MWYIEETPYPEAELIQWTVQRDKADGEIEVWGGNYAFEVFYRDKWSPQEQRNALCLMNFLNGGPGVLPPELDSYIIKKD